MSELGLRLAISNAGEDESLSVCGQIEVSCGDSLDTRCSRTSDARFSLADLRSDSRAE